jgi:hypothetical protein
MRPAALAVLLALVAGCSVWNRPDPFDGGGADAPVDALDASFDTPDAGADAPDGPLPRPRETVCDDGRDDEDLDGLIDCADPDCASNVALCCRESRPAAVIDEDWCGGVPSSWRGVGALTATDRVEPCSLSGDDRVAALLNGGCVPVPSGLVIAATLAWSGSCPDCEAMVALSPIRDVPAGGLLEELALRMREDDQTNVVVELTRAGRVLGRLPAPGTGFGAGDVSLTLSLFPALDDEGRPVIRATLRAVWDDGMQSAELDALDALAPRDLTGPALGCSVAPGLFLGVQTRGRAGRIGELLAWPQQCSNPALFRPAGFPAGVPADASWLEASDLGFAPAPATAWTAGGVGAATSVPLRTDATVVDWHWFVDGTNLNRANDRDRALDFSFGGALARHPGLIGFTPRRGGEPLAGHLAPTCAGAGSDCGVDDFREPALFVPREPDGSRAGGRTAYAVWVSRADDGSSWLGRAAFTDFRNSADTLPPPLEIDTGCAAPSHPAILSPDPSGDDGHLLVFVCGAEVWGLRVDAEFMPVGEAAMLFEAGTLGFPLGILDVDGAVFDRTYRLWVAGRDGRGGTRLAITEARIRDDGPLEFVPFGGNPVLSIDDPIFQTGPDRCVGVCRITGVGVAREPGAMDSTRWGPRVRVLVSVTDEGASVRHAVVPLEQWMP